MYGLIISKFVVQTFYMNWKWPLEIMKEFELNGTKCIKIGFSSIYNISRKEKNII